MAELDWLREDMQELKGHVSSLSEKVEAHGLKIALLRQDLKGLTTSVQGQQETRLQRATGRYGVLAALVTALGALATSILGR